jgi:hypothetical protein
VNLTIRQWSTSAMLATVAVASFNSIAAADGLFSAGGSSDPSDSTKGSSPFKMPDIDSVYDPSAPKFMMPDLGVTPESHAQAPPEHTILDTASDTPALPSEKPEPWYRYMTLGPDLARELKDSEHSLLPIVPVPLNIRGNSEGANKSHHVLLCAARGERFASFQTMYGHLFAKSEVVCFVSTSRNMVRIYNCNGKEGQVLFKFPDGQLICLGAGTEMLIGPALDKVSLNPNDGIARRGITRLPKDGPRELAFAQFQFESFFEIPELKYLASRQPQTVAILRQIAGQINAIRGEAGFKKAIVANEHAVVVRKPAPEKKQPAPPVLVRALPPPPKQKPTPVTEKKPAKPVEVARSVEMKPAPKRVDKTVVEKKMEKAVIEKASKPDKASRPETTEKTADSGLSLASVGPAITSKLRAFGRIRPHKDKTAVSSETKPSAEVQPAKVATAVVSPPVQQKKVETKPEPTKEIHTVQTASSSNAPAPDKKKRFDFMAAVKKPAAAIEAKVTAAANAIQQPKQPQRKPQTLYVDYGQAGVTYEQNATSGPKLSSADPSLAQDAKALIASAEREEKKAVALRKQAKKSHDFVNSGFLNPDQCQKMMNEANRHNVCAAIAEDKARELRQQAQVAVSKPAAAQPM